MTPRPQPSLTRWERYYLESARRGVYASFPRHSKVADSLHAKGYISGFGFVMGNRVEHNLTQAGVDVWDTARPPTADDSGR